MNGICNLAIIPIRKQPSSASEMVSQLLFGDTYKVINQQDNWIEIVTDADHYSGFINDKQHSGFNLNTQDWLVNTQYPFLNLQLDNGYLLAPAGCLIPHESTFQINTDSYHYATALSKYNQSDIAMVAKQYLHTPYLWGGKTAFGIDCSGLTQMVFKQCGIKLPRDAYQQAEQGETVAFVEETEPGDLAFFDNSERRITHVGIMLENQQIIHASGKVRIDLLDHYGILNQEDKNYSHQLRIIKRFF